MDDAQAPTFDSYDAKVAASMHASGKEMLTGLPAYLEIRTVDVGPGTMVAEMDVRPDLLNPPEALARLTPEQRRALDQVRDEARRDEK